MLHPTLLSLQIHAVFYDTLGSLISVRMNFFRAPGTSQIVDGKAPESKEDCSKLETMHPSSGGYEYEYFILSQG